MWGLSYFAKYFSSHLFAPQLLSYNFLIFLTHCTPKYTPSTSIKLVSASPDDINNIPFTTQLSAQIAEL